ncbi:MAG: pyridoxal-phosphate dependent enzyme, partial [bacterium]
MTDFPISSETIRKAYERLRPHVKSTPIIRSDHASDQFDREVYLKCENTQRSGSFKIRGATNAILKQADQARKKGVVTASAGNHAQGVAYGG